MSAVADKPDMFQLWSFKGLRGEARASMRLRLLPSGDGWSLVGPDGKLVFQALGSRGRRQCLEFARAHGVLAISS
jgi:hypothetical protein